MSTHGSCNGCGKGFGLLRKQDSCQNCGLTFCTKCVVHKTAIPKLNNEVQHVCARCFNILSGKIKDNTQKRDVSPPANFIKNLQAAQQKQQTVATGGSRKDNAAKKGVTSDPKVKRYLKPEYRNLSKDDMEIAERLEKLKEEHRELELGPNPLPPIQDVEQRLARLKGHTEVTAAESTANSSSSTVTPTYNSSTVPTKTVTQQEETSNLLKQVTDEVNIDRRVSGEPAPPVNTATPTASAEDSKQTDAAELAEMHALIAQAASELEIDAAKALVDLKKDKEIMARIEELKTRRASKSEADDVTAAANAAAAGDSAIPESGDEDSEDEEVQVKNIVQQALEERMLDERLEASGGFKPPLRKEKSVTSAPPPELEGDEDELPWCCICNEDATIRCIDCDMDLYCNRCYKDGHKQLYDDDHQAVPYKKRTAA